MSSRTIDHSGRDEMRPKKPNQEELEILHLRMRWLMTNGDEMPIGIQALPLGLIRVAVERTEAGEQVFVPTTPVVVTGDDTTKTETESTNEDCARSANSHQGSGRRG